MDIPENNNNLQIPPKPPRFSRTVWTKFVRTITWIGFWLIIASGALLFLTAVIMTVSVGTPIPLLLGVLWAGISVLIAFLLCSKAFIKLDMADDIHKIREMLEKR